jgi:hypothetical protein
VGHKDPLEGGHGKGVRLNESPLALRQGASACSRFDGKARWIQGGHGKAVRDISRIPGEGITAGPSTERIVTRGTSRGGAGIIEISGHHVIPGSSIGHIATTLAIHFVTPASTRDLVVAFSAMQNVVARVAGEVVIAWAPDDGVVAG